MSLITRLKKFFTDPDADRAQEDVRRYIAVDNGEMCPLCGEENLWDPVDEVCHCCGYDEQEHGDGTILRPH